MRATYRFLAYAIDGLIMVQAAVMAWAIFGFGKYIDDGNSFSKSQMESSDWNFTEERGFMVHGINGQMLIPLVGLILLIVAFFAKVPGGTKWAGMLFGGIVVQVALGIFGHGLPLLGLLHGANALLLFWLAWKAAKAAEGHVETTAPDRAYADR